MPFRRALAVIGLCLACAPAWADPLCDPAQQQLPPSPDKVERDFKAVAKLADIVSKIKKPFDAVPEPKDIPTDPDQAREFLTPWNEQLLAYRATHFYRDEQDLSGGRTGKLPSGDVVPCDETEAIVRPDGHRVTMTRGEFQYFVRWHTISTDNFDLLEKLLSPGQPQQQQTAKLKPAKVKHLLGWLHRDADELAGQQASAPSR